jgi:hypothetical protein
MGADGTTSDMGWLDFVIVCDITTDRRAAVIDFGSHKWMGVEINVDKILYSIECAQ